MKVKITKEVPVQEPFRPKVGKVYRVIGESETLKNLVYVNVNDTKVGVFLGKECEVSDNA